MSDQWTDRLSEYLDDTLAIGEREALEAHLALCPACAGALDELRRVVTRARALDDRPPVRDLWPGIATHIGLGPGRQPRVAGPPERRPLRGRRFSFTAPQLLAASVALVLLSGGAVWLLGPRQGPRPIDTAPPAPTPTRWILVTGHRYDQAVAELERALDEGKRSGRLDTATVRILEQNLAIIDTAITQGRRALASDPGDAYLNHHLAETMRRKLELLRQATAIAGS